MSEWVAACKVDDVEEEDVIPFRHEGKHLAIYRSPAGEFYCTDGICSHERAFLARGLVMGHLVECPKHNARFDYRTGEAKRAPAREAIRTYPVKVEDGTVYVELEGEE